MGFAGVPLSAAETTEILRREALGESALTISRAIYRPRATIEGFLDRHHGRYRYRACKREKGNAPPIHFPLKPDDPGEPSLDYQLEIRESIIAQDEAFVRRMARVHPELIRK